LVVAALSAFGCERRATPELLTLTEVTPSEVDVGERVDVLGLELPSGEVHEARVTFRGSLKRPGRATLGDQVIEVEGAQVSPDRVSFVLGDSLAERFLGKADDAAHTTFHGTVEVAMPSVQSATPVIGTLKGQTTIDFVPRAPRKAVEEDRARESQAALEFLGVELGGVEHGRGVEVLAVREGSPAARAGVEAHDRIVEFEGVRVLSAGDVLPSGVDRAPSLGLLRGDERIDRTVDIEGFRSDATRDLLGAVVILGTLLVVLLALGTKPARALSWVERRLERGLARHRREGGHAGSRLVGFVRSVVRGSTAPKAGALAVIAPVVVFFGVSATFALIPIVELRRRAELDVGILYLLSLTSLVSMALVTGGWDAERAWTPLAGLRAALRVVVCELPAALAICAVVMLTGSLRLRDITLGQVGSGASWAESGSFPYTWYAVKSPQLFLLFLLFFTTVLVEGRGSIAARPDDKTRPASISGAGLGALDSASPASISSFRRAAFFFAEWSSVFLMCGIGSALFLGGWYVPGVSAQEHEVSTAWQALGTLLFLVKSWGLVALVLAIRTALPKVRAEALVGLGLRVGLPISLVCLGLTAVSALYPFVPTVELMIGLVTLSSTIVISAAFVWSVARGAAAGRAKASANALL
jgi:NADH-quinone oxidoreductase subunit H